MDCGGISPCLRDLNGLTFYSNAMTIQSCASLCVVFSYFYLGLGNA
jgi:hypothetical protein